VRWAHWFTGLRGLRPRRVLTRRTGLIQPVRRVRTNRARFLRGEPGRGFTSIPGREIGFFRYFRRLGPYGHEPLASSAQGNQLGGFRPAAEYRSAVAERGVPRAPDGATRDGGGGWVKPALRMARG
jgi:hypothetical protein